MKHPAQSKPSSCKVSPTTGGTTVKGVKEPKRRHGGSKKK